jgi:hypothetical protein
MDSSVPALALSLSFVAWLLAPELEAHWHRADWTYAVRSALRRARSLWIWRHGRERAAAAGVIDC